MQVGLTLKSVCCAFAARSKCAVVGKEEKLRVKSQKYGQRNKWNEWSQVNTKFMQSLLNSVESLTVRLRACHIPYMPTHLTLLPPRATGTFVRKTSKLYLHANNQQQQKILKKKKINKSEIATGNNNNNTLGISVPQWTISAIKATSDQLTAPLCHAVCPPNPNHVHTCVAMHLLAEQILCGQFICLFKQSARRSVVGSFSILVSPLVYQMNLKLRFWFSFAWKTQTIHNCDSHCLLLPLYWRSVCKLWELSAPQIKQGTWKAAV